MIGATPAEQLQRLSEIILRGYWEAHPGEAQWLGLHEYDGRVPNFQAAAVSGRISTIREQLDLLGQIDRQALGPEQAIDLELLRSLLESERFYLWELREQERNPLAYADAVDLSPYLKRNYAPLEERARRLGRHARQIPTVIAQARENLREPMPRTFIDTAIGVFEGTANFIRDEVPAALKGIEPPVDLPDDLAKAADAVQGFVEFLRAERERATDDFAIGAERFREMLRSGEMIDVPLDRLLEIGQRDLERNLEAARETARQIDASRSVQEIMADMSRDHPKAAQLIPETTRMLEDLRQFLVERAVVTIPSEVRCRVEETPSFMRWAFAMMDAAGPFETQATESYYYVTPPEPDWPHERREEWLSQFNRPSLRDISVHEAYPGHYVHLLHLHQNPSPVRKTVLAYSFIEGWAHYCEEMMLEVGYGDGDLYLRLAQLSEALVRDCRFVAAIGLHTQGMTVDEATHLFVEKAFREEAPARQEAERGTFDPGYLNYTLGKLMMLKLRDDYRAERGADFSLRDFHDRVLALGSPPFPLARRALLTTNVDAVL